MKVSKTNYVLMHSFLEKLLKSYSNKIRGKEVFQQNRKLTKKGKQ